MKKTIHIIIISILFLIPLTILIAFLISSSKTSDSLDFDFFFLPQNVKIGMDKDEFIKIMNKHVHEKPDETIGIVYRPQKLFKNKKVEVSARVIDSKITVVSYFIRFNDDNNDILDYYEQFKTALSEKYGECDTEEEDWRNEIYKDDPDMFYEAIKPMSSGYRFPINYVFYS